MLIHCHGCKRLIYSYIGFYGYLFIVVIFKEVKYAWLENAAAEMESRKQARKLAG